METQRLSKFQDESAQVLYEGTLAIIESILLHQFDPSVLGWSAVECGPVNSVYDLLSVAAKGGNAAAPAVDTVLGQCFPIPSNAEEELSEGSTETSVTVKFHVRDLPIESSKLSLQPLLTEIMEAFRDVLRGDCWKGAPCILTLQSWAKAMPSPRSQPFATAYLGPSGTAAYGVALSLGCFIAAAHRSRDPKYAIPEMLSHAAVFQGKLVLQPDDLQQRLFQQLDHSHAVTRVNRPPSDWDFRDVIHVGWCCQSGLHSQRHGGSMQSDAAKPAYPPAEEQG